MVQEIVKLHNDLVGFCKKYSKRYGDCYNCPIGQKIKEYCQVDGLIRWLERILNK